MNDLGTAATQTSRLTSQPSRTTRRWWTVITTLLAAAVFSEAIFAGVMLSGIGWGRTAHAANAGILIALTWSLTVVAVVTLRRIPHGQKLGVSLLTVGVVLLLQAALGTWSTQGANLMWAHVPLGAALVGFATQAAARARKLGEE